MQETSKNQKKFQNGKQLLESCIYRLNDNQRGETGGNVALYPTVIVMLGQKSRDQVKHIKTTLDDNWNNARFLQYLNVAKTDSGWQCFLLCDEIEQGPDEPAWRPTKLDWEEALSSAIVTMLETEEKIFAKRTTVKLEYVLDASEADSMAYFELFCQTTNALQADELKTLYLMLDQRPGKDRVEASDTLLQHMVKRQEEAELSGTVYLLSNYLQSGQMLSDSRLWQNYRLAADIMLLGGNRREAEGAVQKLFHGFKTVSYALVTKPVDEIAGVSLRTLLQEMYKTEHKRQYRELSISEIAGKLQMDRYHGFLFLEELFQKKIRPKLPKEMDWQYLPFRTVQDYHRFFKSSNMTMQEADGLTCGAAASFLDSCYLAPVREFLSNETELAQCRERISGLLAEQFSCFELLYLKEHPKEQSSMILAEYQFAGFRQKESSCRRLHTMGLYESRRLFYGKMKQLMAAELEQLMQRAQEFRELYEACIKEIRQECIVTGDESKSVEKFYSKIAAEFVERRQKPGEHVASFPEVFRAASEKRELLGAVWTVFLELMQEKVFDCDFEQEVSFRMDGMDEKQRHTFVSEELRRKLEGSRRLRNSIEIPMAAAGCYYMVNASADYAKALERADNGEYVLFDLNRTDCIEQLQIYDILKPGQLHLGGVS